MQENIQEKSHIKRNISLFLREMGVSEYRFYRETGIARGILSQNNGISEDNLMRFLAAYPQVSASWLLTGEGNMLKGDAAKVADSAAKYGVSVIHTPKYTEAIRDQQVVYLYDIEATAGLRAIMDNKSQNIIDTIRIPNLPKCDGAIHVVGDSMYPILKSGDIVLYKEVTNMADIFWGEMYLLSIAVDDEEYITVKYLQRSDEGKDYVRLVSHNQHHSPKDIPTSSITALAIVKASVRLNTIR
ncbi:helix-turn-helix transcriptional regulator [Porphyromonas gulae]|nr:helix-turn-helix transcriptional regulator [Porphyromonas gulae]